MIQWTSKPKRMQNILLGYWVAAPSLFYIYLALISLRDQVGIQTIIQQVPTISIGNLVACLMLLQAGLLFFIQRNSQSRNGLLGHFLLGASLQQLLTGNLIGAFLAFFSYRSLLPIEEKTTTQQKLLFYLVMGFLLLLSILVLFITLRLANV